MAYKRTADIQVRLPRQGDTAPRRDHAPFHRQLPEAHWSICMETYVRLSRENTKRRPQMRDSPGHVRSINAPSNLAQRFTRWHWSTPAAWFIIQIVGVHESTLSSQVNDRVHTGEILACARFVVDFQRRDDRAEGTSWAPTDSTNTTTDPSTWAVTNYAGVDAQLRVSPARTKGKTVSEAFSAVEHSPKARAWYTPTWHVDHP